MSSVFNNFWNGMAFGFLASNPFFGGMFGYGCGCGYGGVGGFLFGGMYNAVNLTGFANPFPSIFGGYMGGGYASSAGLIMPTNFANAQFPTVDFSGPCQTIWDTYTNPNSDYNKQMIDWFQKINSQQNPFSRTDRDETDTEKSSSLKESTTSKASNDTEKSKKKDKINSKSTNVVKKTKTTAKHWSKMTDDEMKEVYGNYTESITTKYTGTANDLNKVLKGQGVLEGKGQAFIDAQNKYGISASVLAAITMNESGHGKSNLAKKNNNVGGVRIAGSTEFRKFSSVEECIMEMARFLKSGYANQGITMLYQVNAKYCPASDPTDKDNLNAKWASIVSSNLHQIDNYA